MAKIREDERRWSDGSILREVNLGEDDAVIVVVVIVVWGARRLTEEETGGRRRVVSLRTRNIRSVKLGQATS